jgi:hypothetical protein
LGDIAEKSAPTITTFGVATTKAKIGSDTVQAEEQITNIIGGWRHLVGVKLTQELTEYADGVARASAHLVVSWV